MILAPGACQSQEIADESFLEAASPYTLGERVVGS